jgi:hypothetical protein
MILNYNEQNILNLQQLETIVFTPVKKCTKCAQIKVYSDFSKDKKAKFGIFAFCKKCNSIRAKKYRKENEESIKKYREENKEETKHYGKIYYQKNKKDIRHKRRKNNKKYFKNRYETDEIFRTTNLIRGRIRRLFKSKGLTKNKKTLEMLGTTFENFTFHLESQFKDGMIWENQGKVWHIDHKVPLSLAKTEEEAYKLNHHTNLQPLFSEENLSKSAKLIPEHEELYKTLLNR